MFLELREVIESQKARRKAREKMLKQIKLCLFIILVLSVLSVPIKNAHRRFQFEAKMEADRKEVWQKAIDNTVAWHEFKENFRVTAVIKPSLTEVESEYNRIFPLLLSRYGEKPPREAKQIFDLELVKYAVKPTTY